MNQTRLESLVEALVNVMSGFFLSWLVWMGLVGPYFHLETTAYTSLGITSIFTAISIARSYFWRRFFAKGLHKLVHRAFSSWD